MDGWQCVLSTVQQPVILVVKAGCRLMHIPSHMPLCSYVAHTICVPCCGKRKKNNTNLPLLFQKKYVTSFEPDSNQRPMDDFSTTVHRSTNWAIEGCLKALQYIQWFKDTSSKSHSQNTGWEWDYSSHVIHIHITKYSFHISHRKWGAYRDDY